MSLATTKEAPMTARLSSHTAKRVVELDLPVEVCEKLIERALTEFGATRVHRTREKTHALAYQSVVEAGEQNLEVEAVPLKSDRCRVKIVSRPVAAALPGALQTVTPPTTVEDFERVLMRIVSAHRTPA
jgi:hypothetical protein